MYYHCEWMEGEKIDTQEKFDALPSIRLDRSRYCAAPGTGTITDADGQKWDCSMVLGTGFGILLYLAPLRCLSYKTSTSSNRWDGFQPNEFAPRPGSERHTAHRIEWIEDEAKKDGQVPGVREAA